MNWGSRLGGDERKDAIAAVDLCGVVAVRAGVACKIFPNGGAVTPRAYVGLRAADCGGWSSAITPLCSSSVARSSGVLPSLSNLLGLMSASPRSIFTAPSCPFHEAR